MMPVVFNGHWDASCDRHNSKQTDGQIRFNEIRKKKDLSLNHPEHETLVK